MQDILNLLNNNNLNWRQELAKRSIKIIKDDDYILLKYDIISSDFSDPIVQQCRGSIFYYNGSKFECVCAPFYKFGNYGESWVKDVDWSTAVVQDKIDGSLIKLWYHNGWHISTFGTIDAKQALTINGLTNFHDLFIEAIGGYEKYDDLCNMLPKYYTYMFELVSPKNLLTIHYNCTNLYLIGLRDMVDFKELNYNHILNYFYYCKINICTPTKYKLNTLQECLSAVNAMTKDQEGFVVVDKNYNRIKIKSPEFLKAFHLINNNIITIDNVIDAIEQNYIDDYCAYVHDELKMQISKIVQIYQEIIKHWNDLINKNEAWFKLGRADFAELVKINCVKQDRDFMFRNYNNKISAEEYFISIPKSTKKNLIKEKML